MTEYKEHRLIRPIFITGDSRIISYSGYFLCTQERTLVLRLVWSHQECWTIILDGNTSSIFTVNMAATSVV